MKRAAFVAASLAAIARPSASTGETIDIHDLITQIPGITGVYARTLGATPPLISVRANESFAAASVIKLTIMVTAYRAFDARTASPDDEVPILASDIIGGSPSFGTAEAGEKYHLHTLIRAMIRQSDNTASNALISAFGFDAINRTIRHCGMTGTRLGRHFADYVPASHVSLNVTTPGDIGKLLCAIENGSREQVDTIVKALSCRAMIDIMLGQEDKSKIPSGLPSGTPCANKTGEIDRVRNDAAIVDPYGDKPFILVVLTRELDDWEAGNRGIAAIAHRVDAFVRASELQTTSRRKRAL
jgi:beta-lactamase class A